MNWKNGGGFSDEIAIYPPQAEFSKDPFLWRLSSAKIEGDGPFSLFDNYHRILTLISEGAMQLARDGGEKTLDVHKGSVIDFSGSEKVNCFLSSGSVRDLGLIFRRDQVKAEFKLIEIKGKPRGFNAEGKTVFIFCVDGSLNVSVYPNEEKFLVSEMDTLRYEVDVHQSSQEYLFLLESKSPSCSAIWIELDYS